MKTLFTAIAQKGVQPSDSIFCRGSSYLVRPDDDINLEWVLELEKYLSQEAAILKRVKQFFKEAKPIIIAGSIYALSRLHDQKDDYTCRFGELPDHIQFFRQDFPKRYKWDGSRLVKVHVDDKKELETCEYMRAEYEEVSIGDRNNTIFPVIYNRSEVFKS